MIRAGELKNSIGIYHSTNLVNEYGEKTASPLTLYKKIRAGIIYRKGREAEDNLQLTPTVIIEAVIRYDTSFDETYTIQYNNELYNITGIAHKDKSATMLYLQKTKLWDIAELEPEPELPN